MLDRAAPVISNAGIFFDAGGFFRQFPAEATGADALERPARAARKEAAMLEALSLAAGLSWASGLRLYLTIFVAGVFERMGLVHLPDALAVLGSPWVIGVARVLSIVEFLADKIPAFDSLWDAIHTLIRIPAGAVLAAASFGHADPALVTIAALAGGTLRRRVAFREGGHARADRPVAGTGVELGGLARPRMSARSAASRSRSSSRSCSCCS